MRLTIKQIVNAVDGILVSGNHCDDKKILINNVSTDSRKIISGDLFVPIKGEVFDGHDFLEEVLSKGAVCVFCEEDFSVKDECCYIKVKDSAQALLDLAKYYRSLYPVPVIGVTGSVGKTTTKDIIASVLSQKYNVLKNQGNYNNGIGVPATLFELNENHELAVIEMGMNSFGEIHRLSEITQPKIAVITNVGVAHIELLGSREGILMAKCEIFDFMNKDGVAVLNADDDMLFALDGKLSQSIVWYGTENKTGIYATDVVTNGIESTDALVHTPIGNFEVKIPVPGEYMVKNALCGVSVGLQFGLTLSEIKKGIEDFKSSKMRMAIIKMDNGMTILNDTYNANPVSMKASIDVLSAATGKKVCILSDMLELGKQANDMHHDIGEYLVNKGIDVIIGIGKLSAYICDGAKSLGHKNATHYNTKDEFLSSDYLKYLNNATILVKGSRGMKMEMVVSEIQMIASEIQGVN